MIITKDLRKTANTAVSPLEINYEKLSYGQHKIEIERDEEFLGEMRWEVYEDIEAIYINYVEIKEQYRQNGLAMLLYKEFSKFYNSEYSGWLIDRTFVNPVAEYTFAKAVEEGLFPESTLEHAKRDYNEADKALWSNELEPKLQDLRRQKQEAV